MAATSPEPLLAARALAGDTVPSGAAAPALVPAVTAASAVAPAIAPRLTMIAGEGVGPELAAVAAAVLAALARRYDLRIHLEAPALAPIGRRPPLDAVVDICRDAFAAGGAVLAGPLGGRHVYDLRRTCGLGCKVSPLHAFPELLSNMRLRLDPQRLPDVLVVRDNAAGIYQAAETETESAAPGGRAVSCTFGYEEEQVRRVVEVAARLAAGRRGRMAVVGKPSALPALGALWRETALAAAGRQGVTCSFLDVDYAVYRLLEAPEELDVVAASNCFGDVLSDAGGLLMGGRGLTYGASFDHSGRGVYQTNHGAAYDLAGTDRANPAGQLLALALLLRESFGRGDAAAALVTALRAVWSAGWRTDDLAAPGTRVVGTRELVGRVVEAIERPPAGVAAS